VSPTCCGDFRPVDQLVADADQRLREVEGRAFEELVGVLSEMSIRPSPRAWQGVKAAPAPGPGMIMPKSIPVFQISAKNSPVFLMCTGNGKNAAGRPVFAHVHINLILMCKSNGKNALGTPVFAHVHINLDIDVQERRQT
jgi:hypothetical protein